MNQENRAVRRSRHFAEHGGDRLDLLVRVLVDLMRLDEWVDDEETDAVLADPSDAGIHVGLTDHHVVAIRAGEQQRPIGT